MNKSFLLLLLGLQIPLLGLSQTDSVGRSTATVLFGKEVKVDNKNQNKNNLIKFAFSDFNFGKYGLIYERNISMPWALEIGTGVTFKNLIGNFIRKGVIDDSNDEESPTFSDYDDFNDQDYNFDSREVKAGYYYYAMAKYYYDNERKLHGEYFGLNYQFRKYKFKAYGLDPIQASMGFVVFDKGADEKVDEFENNLSIALNWGMQRVQDNFVFDMSFGVGILKVDSERRDVGYLYDANNFDRIAIVANTPRKYSKTLPYIEIAFKIGVGW